MTQFDTNTSTGWALMRHKGVHEHPWPKAKKPDPLSKEEFEKQVKNNPKAGAFKLKVNFFTFLISLIRLRRADRATLLTLMSTYRLVIPPVNTTRNQSRV
jgi:hypothetical protein